MNWTPSFSNLIQLPRFAAQIIQKKSENYYESKQ